MKRAEKVFVSLKGDKSREEREIMDDVASSEDEKETDVSSSGKIRTWNWSRNELW